MATVVVIEEHRTSGGRLPLTVEDPAIVEVSGQGVEVPAGAKASYKVLLRWLMDHELEPAGFKWIDPPGHLRKRRATYRSNGEGMTGFDPGPSWRASG